MKASRRRHARQRRQIRRAVRFLHETHDRVPFDPVGYIEALAPRQIARLVQTGHVSLLRLRQSVRRAMHVWADKHGVHLP